MLIHKKIRDRQVECREQFRAGRLTAAKYDAISKSLNKELEKVEQKMYTTAYSEQLDLLKFVTDTIPPAFKKIHNRFPHLTFDEVIAFEKIIREAGGSIMTHSGKFILTQREIEVFWNSVIHDYSLTWTCCHSIYTEKDEFEHCIYYDVRSSEDSYIDSHGAYWCNIDYSTKYEQKRLCMSDDYCGFMDREKPKASPDLKNPNPIGQCDSPILFSLTGEYNVNGCTTVAEIREASATRLKQLKKEIADMNETAAHLQELCENLALLTVQ